MRTSLVPRSLASVVEAARGPSWPAQAGRWLSAIAIFVAVVELVFGLSAPDFVSGLALGSLYGIIGVGIVLIYRTTRVINFAAGAVGAVPVVIALVLVLEYGVNYLAVLPIVVVGGPVLGLLADLVMRRFDGVPRLIATVMTIAVAQSLAVLAFFIPVWLGQKASNEGTTVATPWQHLVWHTSRGQPLLTGNEIAAFVTVAVVTVGVAAFLRLTRLGIALRASAENADRALLLGIPVRRVSAAAWALAGLLAALAIYVQVPLIGTPNDATLGLDTLLYALAAAVVSRMERFGVALAAGMGIGVLITATIISSGDNSISSSIMVLVILGALLTQPRRTARALDAGEGRWQTVKQYRPISAELRKVPEVAAARWGIGRRRGRPDDRAALHPGRRQRRVPGPASPLRNRGGVPRRADGVGRTDQPRPIRPRGGVGRRRRWPRGQSQHRLLRRLGRRHPHRGRGGDDRRLAVASDPGPLSRRHHPRLRLRGAELPPQRALLDRRAHLAIRSVRAPQPPRALRPDRPVRGPGLLLRLSRVLGPGHDGGPRLPTEPVRPGLDRLAGQRAPPPPPSP